MTAGVRRGLRLVRSMLVLELQTGKLGKREETDLAETLRWIMRQEDAGASREARELAAAKRAAGRRDA